jgi:glucose-1-phosphate adenylyltransferase
VLVLAGDHIYKMDYGPMIAYHVEKGADITVGVVEVPREGARIRRAVGHRVEPRHQVRREAAGAGMRFPAARRRARLDGHLRVQRPAAREAADRGRDRRQSKHDFGKNIIPAAIDTLQVFAYPFTDVKTRAQNYWRDVGTVDAYYDANIELVHVAPELNLYDEEWPIWTYQAHQPPAKFVLDEDGRRGMAINSMVSGGCIISGAVVASRCCSPTCASMSAPASIRSVVLPNVKIGAGCTIRQAILDEGCEVPDGMQIGVDRGADAARFHVTERGVVLVTPEMLQQGYR